MAEDRKYELEKSLEHSADKRNKIMSRLKSIDGDRQHIEL